MGMPFVRPPGCELWEALSSLPRGRIARKVTATAIKRGLARQVEAAMKEKNFSKAEMARRMHTSRAAR